MDAAADAAADAADAAKDAGVDPAEDSPRETAQGSADSDCADAVSRLDTPAAVAADAAVALGFHDTLATYDALEAAFKSAGWAATCFCTEDFVQFTRAGGDVLAHFSALEATHDADSDKWLFRPEDIVWSTRGPVADFDLPYRVKEGALEDLQIFAGDGGEYRIAISRAGRLPKRLPKRYHARVRAFLTAVCDFEATQAAKVVQRAWRWHLERRRGTCNAIS